MLKSLPQRFGFVCMARQMYYFCTESPTPPQQPNLGLLHVRLLLYMQKAAELQNVLSPVQQPQSDC